MTEEKYATQINTLPSAEKESGGIASLLGEVVRFSLIALLFVVPIRIFVAQPYIVSGTSMYPTFQNGEYLIVDQLFYRFNAPERGDVVIFRFPHDPRKFFIKRIIGLPGETISYKNGTLSVTPEDGVAHSFDEPYLAREFQETFSATLKDGEYFVMGDNRNASLDSRMFGAVSETQIVGRAFLRLLPPTRIGAFPGFYDFQL